MEKNKKTVLHMVICIGLLCLIWLGYLLAVKYGVNRRIEIRGGGNPWVYQVDSVAIQKQKCILSGFVFELNADAKSEVYEIVLHDLDTGKNFFPKMEYGKREDVNRYFECEYDYEDSGFSSSIDMKKIRGRNYEILLRVIDEKDAYHTGTYLLDGKLQYVNPYENQLEVEGTDLEEIINQGKARVYRPDCGMYVYQYDNELYWIAEPEYDFVDGDTYIQYQLNTTQIERLPKYRLENGWYWDNIGFWFSECEVTEMDTGKYRVAKKEIPQEYSIRGIWTGNYGDDWIWRADFLPYYTFE